MRIRGLGRLRQAAWRVCGRFTNSALILLYHRVAKLPSDPNGICVSPEHFAEHLEMLGKNYRPLGLQQLIQALRDGKRLYRAVVITLDDGYADTLYNARPLLERFDIPATAFVTAGDVVCERGFWWDELDRLLLQPEALPGTLSLTINGRLYQWDLGEAALPSKDLTRRKRLYRTIFQTLRSLPNEEQWKVLDSLVVWSGLGTAPPRPTHRALSPGEVLRLAEGGLVEVGAHTVTHPVLSALPIDAQRDEILRNKALLEEILMQPVSSFAYPFGTRSDYTEETVAIVREAGFSSACSNFPDVVLRDVDRFQLPRTNVQDCDGETLDYGLWERFRN